MKRLLVLILVLQGLSPLHAQGIAQPTPGKQLTPDEVAARRERMMKVNGGFIRKPGSQQGRILFLNAQKSVPEAKVRETLDLLGKHFKIRIDLENRMVESPMSLSGVTKVEKSAAVIALGEMPNIPALLTAPDEHWAYVNVAPLKGGDLDGRARKQLIRAFAFLCGAASSSNQGTLMDNMDSLDRLDITPETALTGDVIIRMTAFLKTMGVTPYTMRTYKRACIEGWAPAPTNDYQKAIWDKVRAEIERGPSKPITIPPPKK